MMALQKDEKIIVITCSADMESFSQVVNSVDTGQLTSCWHLGT